MSNPIIQSVVEKISQLLRNFYQKEEQIKKTGHEAVMNAIKESDEKKIAEIKNKINQI